MCKNCQEKFLKKIGKLRIILLQTASETSPKPQFSFSNLLGNTVENKKNYNLYAHETSNMTEFSKNFNPRFQSTFVLKSKIIEKICLNQSTSSFLKPKR